MNNGLPIIALAALLLGLAPALGAADSAPFDLKGPELVVNVTRGDRTLPVSEVPNLMAGDRVAIRADLPTTQTARYVMVVAFLRPRIAGGTFARSDAPLNRARAVAGGLLTFAAYGLVLTALSRAPLVIVAPLRESAVLLTSMWGVVRLREAGSRSEITMRFAGAVIVLAGAATLAVAR